MHTYAFLSLGKGPQQTPSPQPQKKKKKKSKKANKQKRTLNSLKAKLEIMFILTLKENIEVQ